MAEFDAWLNLMVIFAALPAIYMIFKVSWVQSSVTESLFGVALLSLIVSRAVEAYKLFTPYTKLIIEWSDLTGLVFILSGLFMMIRQGKPSYSRYPLLLIFLPSIVLIFYPMILDAEVIKSMLILTFAGGCVLVALMITFTRHFVHQRQTVLVTGVVMLTISYLLYIGFKLTSDTGWIVFRELFLAFGMITTAFGILTLSNKSNPTKNEI